MLTSASTKAPRLDPIRIRVGVAGVVLPTSPTFTRIRCSMYVSGVVSGSMLTFIVRGPWSIAVLPPVFHESASEAPVVDVPRVPSFASTERKRPA